MNKAFLEALKAAYNEVVNSTAAQINNTVPFVGPSNPPSFSDSQSSFVVNHEDAALRGVLYFEAYRYAFNGGCSDTTADNLASIGIDGGFRDIGHRGVRWHIMQSVQNVNECVVFHRGTATTDEALDDLSSQAAFTWKKNDVWMNNAFKVSYNKYSKELKTAMGIAERSNNCHTWDLVGYSLGASTANIHANDVSGDFNIRDVHTVASPRTFREQSPKVEELCIDVLDPCKRVESCENFKNNISGLAIRYNRMNLDGSQFDAVGTMPVGWHHCADYHVGIRGNDVASKNVKWGYNSIDIGSDYPNDHISNIIKPIPWVLGLTGIYKSWHTFEHYGDVFKKAFVANYGDSKVGLSFTADINNYLLLF